MDNEKSAEELNLNQRLCNLQFFNFTPEQVTAERKLVVNSLVTKAMEILIRKVKTPKTEALLNEQKNTVINNITKACEKNLNQLKELDEKTFTVPAHVLQIEDLDLEVGITVEDEKNAIENFQRLKAMYVENMAMLAELNAENAKYSDSKYEELMELELSMQKQVQEAFTSLYDDEIIKLASTAVDKE